MQYLVKFNAMNKAIQECHDIDEIKLIRDKAEAMRYVLIKAKESIKYIRMATEIRVRAERRAGELLKGQVRKRWERDKVLISSDTISKLKLSDMGITPDQSSNWQLIASIPDDRFEEYIKIVKEITSLAAVNLAKEIIKEGEKQKEIDRLKRLASQFDEKDIKIYNEDFRGYTKREISDNSVDAIITDPPYGGEFLPLWEDLFIVGKRILKEGGFLITYSGQMYLDKIFQFAVKTGLDYYWMMSIEFTKKPLIAGRNVLNEWKPILLFQNGFQKKGFAFADKISFDYDKGREMHEDNWGQTVEPFKHLINTFTNPNDLIFEPFAGTGTILVAAKNTKRRCIATEIKKGYIDLIKGRLVNES